MLNNINNNINNISINNSSDNNINNKQIIVQKKSPLKKIGNYLLSHTIGEGAFAKVKLATHIYTGEKVAIKILSKSHISQQEFPKFLNEITLLKSLKHKNIINLYEIIDTPHKLYIIMEYCPNNSLFDYISKRKHLTEREACRLFQQIINAVEYLHLNKITHRDLKPENILLSNNKRIKIIDFGLSKKTLYFNSLLKTPCGTPSYAPPEMLRGENYNGILSDIYSIGIILYTMIVGNLPCLNNFNEEIIYNIMINKSYKYPSYMSLDCIDLIEKMINVNSNERILFKEIKNHKWFNLIESKMRLGILHEIIKIPVDEKILKKIEDYGYNSEDIKKSVIENKYDDLASLYYLELHSWMKEGRKSCSDLYSEEYIKWIKDIKNWEQPEKIYEEAFYEYKNIVEENNNIENINNDYFNIDNYIKKNNDFENFDNIKKIDDYNYYNLNDTSINNSINFISYEHSKSNSINNEFNINKENISININNNNNNKIPKNNIIKKKKNKRKSAFGENLKLQLEPLLKKKKKNSSQKKFFHTKTDNNNNNNTFSFKYKNLLNNNNINIFKINNKNFISFLSPIKSEKKEKLNKKLFESKENFNNFIKTINNTNNSNNNILNIISKKLINTTIFSKYIKSKQNNNSKNKKDKNDILLDNVYRLEKYKNLFSNIKNKHLGIFPKKLYNFNINTLEEVLNIEDDDLVFTNNFYNYNNINENFIKNLKNNIKNRKYNNILLKRKMTYNNILTKKISCLDINNINDININNNNNNKNKKKFIINTNKIFSKRNSLNYKINNNKNNNIKFNIDDDDDINDINIFNNYDSENISSENENNFINKTLTNINDKNINNIKKIKNKNKNNLYNKKYKNNKKIIKKKPNLKINNNNKKINNAIHNNLNQFSIIIKNELNDNDINYIKKIKTNKLKKKLFINNKNFTNHNSTFIDNNNVNNNYNNNKENKNKENNNKENKNKENNNKENNNKDNDNKDNNDKDNNNNKNNNNYNNSKENNNNIIINNKDNNKDNNNKENNNNNVNNNNNKDNNNKDNNNNEQIPKILDLNCFIFLSFFDTLKKIKSFFKSNEYFLNNKNNLVKISKANTKIEIIIFKIDINISYLQIKLKKNLDSNTKKDLNNLLNTLK